MDVPDLQRLELDPSMDGGEHLTLLDLPMEMIVAVLMQLPTEDLPWVKTACWTLYNACIVVYKIRSIAPESNLMCKSWTGAVKSVNRAHEALQWWLEQRMGYHCKYTPCRLAAKWGDPAVMQILWNNHCNIDCDVWKLAARHGRLEVLKWMSTITLSWPIGLHANAARSGHLPTLQWATQTIDPDRPLNPRVCAKAARSGQLRMLQWLRQTEPQPPWDEYTCAMAAKGGHLHVLQWARANGCPWDSSTCWNAAAEGHVHVLRWSIENGCELVQSVFDIAISRGQTTILDYLAGIGHEWRYEKPYMPCMIALVYNHIDSLKWLRKRGYPMPPHPCFVPHLTNGDMLEWIHDGRLETWPCASSPCDWAMKYKCKGCGL